MRWEELRDSNCPVARTLSIIGDRWTFLILRDCFLGVTRFERFQSSSGITRHRLSDRLNRLVENGLLIKVPYQEKPVRKEYRLTEKGKTLYPVMITMAQWGDQWTVDADGSPPLGYYHKSCDHTFEPELKCPECGTGIDSDSVKLYRRKAL